MASRRVLSIQSHVVCGYVGNKSATFPLQVLGFDVDAINSVQFSNHTGYKHIKGQVLDHTELDDLITGLRLNQINCYSHLLTGYIGSVSFLKHVAQVVTELKQVNPQMTYVCDPVMGDNGRMYVPEELLPVYRELIVPRADVLTPNQYEAELLTGRRISDVASACAVMDDLHARGVGTVVLSSTELGCDQALVGLASQLGVNGVRRRFRIDIPRLAASFTGSGDLFAACLLARMHESDGDLAKAFQQTIATLQDVLKRTVQHVSSQTGDSISPFQIELKLVQSLESIRNPRSEVTVQELHD